MGPGLAFVPDQQPSVLGVAALIDILVGIHGRVAVVQAQRFPGRPGKNRKLIQADAVLVTLEFEALDVQQPVLPFGKGNALGGRTGDKRRHAVDHQRGDRQDSSGRGMLHSGVPPYR